MRNIKYSNPRTNDSGGTCMGFYYVKAASRPSNTNNFNISMLLLKPLFSFVMEKLKFRRFIS